MYINNYFKCKSTTLQPKDADWLNGYKNKTHIYAVYNKPTLDPKTYRLKVRGWKEWDQRWVRTGPMEVDLGSQRDPATARTRIQSKEGTGKKYPDSHFS